MSRAAVARLLFQLPGPQRFLARTAEDLGQGRSILMLLPDGVDAGDLWRGMGDELWRRDCDVHEVWLPGIPVDHLPAAALGKALGVRWPSPAAPRTAANLAAAGSLPDVISLGGFADMPTRTRVRWLEFVSQWAQVSKNVSDRGGRPTALCLICPGGTLPAPVPGESLHLSVRYWWKTPSALETRLLCRLAEDARENAPGAGWREYILPSLAGSDFLLVEELWDDIYGGIDHLEACLLKIAQRRGWTAEMLESLDAASWRGPCPAAPDPGQLLPWARGFLSSTPEYGVELHSAAMALLGRTKEVEHRLWRAQAPLLLPLLDSLRLGLCRHLTRHYGPGWPLAWQAPASGWEEAELRESPLTCQWGHLECLVKDCPALRAERRWLQLIGLARFIRNNLAHYRAVDFNSYAALSREVEKAGETI